MVDCGATSRLVNNENNFISFNKTFKPENHYIEMAVGHKTNQLVVAKGTAQFTITDDDNIEQLIHLKNALLAPTIPTSLFSVHTTTQKGAKVNFPREKNVLTVNRTTFPIMLKGRLYFLKTTNTCDSMSATKSLIGTGHWVT